ncbi:spore germination lipoprotein GerD [Alkalibacillus almallahensis]|uniref:spore germination lipoprotein GerD n=1 Tax=Alkalibacillus almallahensis TaxID=1379154 RepID=UPI00141EE681|nr:spore germination lipoprotein GerD [Alkalibacillus almallahensis]NIK12988.1 spore germination protein D [Alkalibacillus almallahensis]
MAKPIIYMVVIVMLLASCSGGSNSQQSSPDYEKTKKMVTDILKTDDGKKALQEALKDESLKQEIVLQSDEVNKAVESMFSGDKGKKFWSELFNDPSFVQSYVDATRKQDQELIKGLMSDSEYQNKMISLFQNEEARKMILQILKSQDYKSHLEKTIQETLNNPVFKAQMTESLIKAAEKMESGQGQSKSEGEVNKQNNGGSSGGGSGGGQSSSGG